MVSSSNSVSILTQIFAPIEDLLLDAEVSEILINGDGSVFVERGGLLHATAVRLDAKSRREAAIQIARYYERDINEFEPLTHVRLEDGSRVALAFPPISIGGAAFAIRKFQQRFFSFDQLVAIGSLSAADAERLRGLILDRLNILIIGGTGTGKTSLLNACANEVDPSHRLAIIEDTAEIQINLPNIFRVECRKESSFSGVTVHAVAAFDAVSEAALRFRPDRIILGEVRGTEAFALLRAWNSGHKGSFSTIHADTIESGLEWLAVLATTGAPASIGYDILRRFVSQAVHVAVLIERQGDKRRIVEIRSLPSN